MTENVTSKGQRRSWKRRKAGEFERHSSNTLSKLMWGISQGWRQRYERHTKWIRSIKYLGAFVDQRRPVRPGQLSMLQSLAVCSVWAAAAESKHMNDNPISKTNDCQTELGADITSKHVGIKRRCGAIQTNKVWNLFKQEVRDCGIVKYDHF